MANRRFIDFPIAASVGNNDIVLIWQDGLNKQTTKATLLQGSPQSLAGLTDVDIAGLINGQILQYNSTTSKWENVDRTDINLSQLGDVTIVAPANGQVLVYNSSTGKWENSSGGYVPYTGAVTTVNLGAQSILAGSFVKAGGTAAQFLKANGSVDSTAYGTGTVTSVALTMPSAFSVGGSPITTAGTLAVTGAGTVGQYIRGDGSLATFPATTGGGSSVTYYLNGSVSQGTIGGVAYREVNRTPIFGAGTDITTSSNGYIANFITDAGDPNKLLIPAGNWNLETYFSANNGGGSPTFYVELYKYNGTTFTLIATSSGTPELIAFGTNINPYFTTLAVPETVLALTDRLALRYYVNTSGRTITLHTENGHLCQVITTFTTGLTALNGLTSQVQFFAVGTSGTDFAISSATDTHTFNLPTASATNRGALSSADWTTFNGKQNALTNPVTGTGTTNYLLKFTGTTTIGNSQVYDSGTGVVIGGAATTNGFLEVIKSGSSIAQFSFGQSTTYRTDLFVDASGNLYIQPQGSTKVTLLATGNFGIGITTPSSLLQINDPASGSTKTFTKYTCGDGGDIRVGKESGVNNDAIFGTWSNNAVIFYANSAEAMRMFSGRNLHIGPTPASDNGARLQVNGTAAISGAVSTNGATAFANYGLTTKGLYGLYVQRGSTNDSGIEIYHDGTNALITSTYQSTGSFGGMLFLTSSTTRLTIASTGAATFSSSVAINGSTSVDSLTVSRNADNNAGGLTLYNANNQGYGSALTFRVNYAGVYNTSRIHGDWWTGNSGALHFFTANTSQSLVERMLIDGSGNLGIGVTPNSWGGTNVKALEVYLASISASLTWGSAFTFNTFYDGSNWKYIGPYTGGKYEIGGDEHIFSNAPSGSAGATATFTTRLKITSGGNVLIGTTTDNGYKLRVNGNLWVDGVYKIGSTSYFIGNSVNPIAFNNDNDTLNNFIIYNNGNTYTRGTVTIASLGTGTVTSTAGVLSSVSDSSYKIEDGFIDSAIEKILNLKPRYFYWNEKSGLPKDIRQLGFYAQEVNEALGEEAANTPRDKNIPWGITDRSIIAMLTKAIQELKQEIDTLKNKKNETN